MASLVDFIDLTTRVNSIVSAFAPLPDAEVTPLTPSLASTFNTETARKARIHKERKGIINNESLQTPRQIERIEILRKFEGGTDLGGLL